MEGSLALRPGEAQAEARVQVEEVAARVVLEACPPSGACRTLTLPRAGGPFRLEGLSPEPYHLLVFLDRDGDGLLDPEEPRGEGEATPPAVGVRLLVR